MLENYLLKTGLSTKAKITVKSAVSLVIILSAVLLPQLVHAVFGASGGVKWLPMYLPVLVGGCLLGFRWGLIVGFLSPLVSFAITAAYGNPMPAADRLPYMMVELAVFCAISGTFSKKVAENKWLAFPAVIAAQIAGRAVFLLLVVAFQGVGGLPLGMVWPQVVTGLLGIGAQAVIAPLIIVILHLIMNNCK